MRTDVRRCSAHNLIHGLRETCPRCAEAKRAEVLAKAGERPTPPVKTCPSAWENVPPYPESRYEPNTLAAQVSAAVARLAQSPTVILPMQDSMDYGQICRLVLEQGLQPAWVSFGRQGAVEISHPRRSFITEVNQDEGRITMSSLTEAEARAKGFAWEDRPEAYEYQNAPKTPAGRLAVLEDFAAAGFFGPQVEPEPFSPETFCPPGREALERAGYRCSGEYEEGRGGAEVWRTLAVHEDGNTLCYDTLYFRVKGDQAERFLAFAWETMALDAGLEIEEEENDDY